MQEPRSKLYKVDAINLRTSKVGEADKIIVLFSRSRGKIQAIAKGARKPKSKFGGRLEPFAYNQIMLAKAKELDIINQVETIDNFYELRIDSSKLLAGAYIVRLIDASTETGQRNEALFDLLLEALRLLKNNLNTQALIKMFEVGLTDVEGFFPVLDRCVKCGKKVTAEPKKVKFNLSLRGIVCSGCSKKVGGIEIPYRIVKIILTLKNRNPEELKSLDMSESDLPKMNLILKTYISDHIGRDIRDW